DAAVGKAGAKGEGGFVVFSGVLRRARDLRTTVDAGRWGTNVSCHWPARFLCNGSPGVSWIVRVNEAAPAYGSDGGRAAKDIAAGYNRPHFFLPCRGGRASQSPSLVWGRDA